MASSFVCATDSPGNAFPKASTLHHLGTLAFAAAGSGSCRTAAGRAGSVRDQPAGIEPGNASGQQKKNRNSEKNANNKHKIHGRD